MKRATFETNLAEPTPKRMRLSQPQNFRKNIGGVGPQQQAFDYQENHGGIVIGRDYGPAKQYYVCQDWDHVYDYVFSQTESHRNFYELIRAETPARLVVDLDLEKKELADGENLTSTMDAIQQQTVDVIHAQLRSLGVESPRIQVLHSDGPEKASRHLLFDTWFTDLHESMKAFVNEKVKPSVPRGLDVSIYSRNRLMRFFGNTKIGSSRRLHIKGRKDLKPFSPEHREAFLSHRVRLTKAEDAKLLNFQSTEPAKKAHRTTGRCVPTKQNASDMDQLKSYVLERMTDCNIVAAIFKTTKQSNGCLLLHTKSKFCWNKNACHTNNHVNYIAGRRGIRQQCFDENCSKTEWRSWPSPRPDFANRLFFARPPQDQQPEGKRVSPSRSQAFLDWTMKSQAIAPNNTLSGDVVPDFFCNAPFDLYAKDIYGFLKLRDMFSCGQDRDYLPTIPAEFLELKAKHKGWLRLLKRILLACGWKMNFVARYLQDEEDAKQKHPDDQIDYMELLHQDPDGKVFRGAVRNWCNDKENKSKLQVWEIFQTAPLNAMRDYYAQVVSRYAEQVAPMISKFGREKRRLYDVLLSAGVDVQLGPVLEDDMLLKLLLHIIKERRWARQAVSKCEKQSGRVECPVLKYNPNTRVYEKQFDCLNDFCIHALHRLREDTDSVAAKYLASNPRVMSNLLRSMEQKWAPLKPDRRYVSFKDGIYDRFAGSEGTCTGRFYTEGSPEYNHVVADATQDIYKYFDIPFAAKPTDAWTIENSDGKTVAAMKPRFTGANDTVIDKILQYQGFSDEDRFVILAAAGRSMLGIKRKTRTSKGWLYVRFDGLKMTLYFDGESDTGKTIVLEILSYAHPEEQVGAFSDEKSFPMSTAVHNSIIVNHESNKMVLPFTTWRNVAEGVPVTAAKKYGDAFYGCIDAMVVGAGNGVCTNYPDTGGAKSARLCRVPMTRIVKKKDSTLLDRAKNTYGVIMHKAVTAYWTWLNHCVKKETWYASLSEESVLYGREAKTRHTLMERFIDERMRVVGFKKRIDENFKFNKGIPNIKLENELSLPESAPDTEPRLTLQKFAALYYKWLTDQDKDEALDNPYISLQDCIKKCFNPDDKKLNTNLGQNFFWNKYHCFIKKTRLGSSKRGEHVVYGMDIVQQVLYDVGDMRA